MPIPIPQGKQPGFPGQTLSKIRRFTNDPKGVVTKVRGTLCPELGVKKGENTEVDYTLAAPKRGGGK